MMIALMLTSLFGNGPGESEILAAVARGRDFLAARQKKDGSFEPEGAAAQLRLGMTALASMALDGRPRERALDWIVAHQGADGSVTDRQRDKPWGAWEHAYATMALVDRPEPFGRAVKWILEHQRSDRLVQTGLQLSMIEALLLARRRGIEIPDGTIRRGKEFLGKQRLEDGGFRNHRAESSPDEITAAALAVLGESWELLREPKDFELPEAAGGDKCVCYVPGRRLYGLLWTGVALRRSPDDDRFERWYAEIATRLLKVEWTGGFGPEYGTSMAILILQLHNGSDRLFTRE